jgi:DNA primase
MFALEDVVTDLLGTGKGHSVNRMFRCEFHDDRTASLSVNLDTGLWMCFGCGAKGNIEGLANGLGERLDGEIALRIAIRKAEETGDYTPPPLFNEQESRYRRALDGAASVWEAFCRDRGISPRTKETYQVGWASDKWALTFPYFDTEGRCIGIKYRSARDGFKWSADGSRFESQFFGPNPAGRDRVVICEGESDTLRVATELSTYDDPPVVVGTSGSPMLASHWQSMAVRLLFAHTVFLLYDADEAGDAAADAGMRMLGEEKGRRVRPTHGKDITEHLLNGGTLDDIGLGATDLHI